ncbi:MAG: 50S ribosomal protein L11 methyltransferase [Hyphomicrobiales bacterium]|nr:50S ribosomal protein L11 methyltransferase [Hyphomicrobiales bacterium]
MSDVISERGPRPTAAARLVTGAARARDLLDRLAEVFDPSQAVISAYDAGERWTVAIHFNDPPNETAVRALVALAADAETAHALRFETIPATDWATVSQEGLRPVHAGRFVVHSEHYRAAVGLNRIGIEVGTAFAFGTGHHPTTHGCLLAIDRLFKAARPRRVLDIGTGTGVLSIAAGKALRRPVLASDIDRRAVGVARENIRRNRIRGIAVIHAAGLGARRFREHAPFDLVLANILLGPLQRMAAPMAPLCAPGARVVLSGLLSAQAAAALAAYRAAGFSLEQRIELDGWSTLILRACNLRRHRVLRRRQVLRRHQVRPSAVTGGGVC